MGAYELELENPEGANYPWPDLMAAARRQGISDSRLQVEDAARYFRERGWIEEKIFISEDGKVISVRLTNDGRDLAIYCLNQRPGPATPKAG